MKFIRFLKKFAIFFVFIGAAIFVNIWKLTQDKPESSVPKPQLVQDSMDSTTSSFQMTTQTQEHIQAQATLTSIVTTTAPIVYQTVDDSYFQDALFIGDSRTEGLALYGNTTNADYFCGVGMTIYDVQEKKAGNPNRNESCTLAQKLAQQQYGKVYIMLGLNELGTGSTEKWASAYADVIAQIREAQPNAIIYIQSILCVSAAKDDPNGAINNQMVHNRNEALKQLENKKQSIYYLNVNEAVTDANGYLDASLTSDGIHLLGKSLSIWKQYLEHHAIDKLYGVSEEPSITTYTTAVSVTDSENTNGIVDSSQSDFS